MATDAVVFKNCNFFVSTKQRKNNCMHGGFD